MFCPKCKAEYRPGFTKCGECQMDLVDKLPDPDLSQEDKKAGPSPLSPHAELVTVFESCDAVQIAIAKSVLQSAGISFTARGDYVQHLWPSAAVGAVEFQVGAEDAEAATELLQDLKVSSQGIGGEEDRGDGS